MNFTKTESEQSEWQAKIYHKVATSSLEECASICRISYISSRECDVFSWDGSHCYIGEEALNSHTITVPSGLSDVYMDQGMSEKISLNVIGIELLMSLHIHSCHCTRNCHLQDSWKCDYKLVSKVHLTLTLSFYSLTFT